MGMKSPSLMPAAGSAGAPCLQWSNPGLSGFLLSDAELFVLWNNETMIRFMLKILQKLCIFLDLREAPDFEFSPFGVVYLDAQTGRVKRANSVFATLMGRSVAQLLTMSWTDLTQPWASMGISAQARLFADEHNGDPLRMPPVEAWVQKFSRPDGVQVVVEVSFLTRVPGPRNTLSWVLIVKDIADRLEEQNRLKVSEQRHRVLSDSARDVIWSMSPVGEITYVSPAVEPLRGVTPTEAMQMPLNETLTPESAAVSVQYFQEVAQALQQGRTPSSFQGELEYYRKDGSTFWSECLSFPLLDSNGGLVEIVGVTRDISERKHYEESLRQARNQAEKANMAKTRFLGHISHEIRTPMSAIMALTDLLLRSDIDDQQREWLQQSQDAGHLLLDMINDVFDLSKMESGQLVLTRQAFDLGSVLQQVSDMVAPACARKGLDFRVELEKGLPDKWVGDASRLTQALMNLVSNAVKFTDRGQVLVRVQRLDRDADWERLRFTVQDPGIGLETALQTDVFEGFELAGGEQVQRLSGVGLGLTLCKRLARLMGGDVGVESLPQQGASFWFTVRLQVSADDAHQGAGLSPSGLSDEVLAGRRILVVDDNGSIRDIVRQLLQMGRVQVDTAENGQIALEMLRQARYDLVLMDLQMPVMGGLEATRLIRQTPVLQNLPVVALTAGGFAGDLDAWKAQGLTDYLAKPFDYKKLLTVLNRHLPASTGGVQKDV